MLTRISGASLLVAFASVANAGMVEVELIPDNPGPYYGGESLTVDVWVHSQVDFDVGLRRVQFDFTDSDPALILGPTFEFDYSSIPDDIGGYIATTSPDMPVPWTANTLDLHYPPMYLQVGAGESVHIGMVALALSTVPGTYELDALNRDEGSTQFGARFTVVPLPGPAPREYWNAFTGQIQGDPYGFRVIPEPTGVVLVVLGGTVLLGARRPRTRKSDLDWKRPVHGGPRGLRRGQTSNAAGLWVILVLLPMCGTARGQLAFIDRDIVELRVDSGYVSGPGAGDGRLRYSRRSYPYLKHNGCDCILPM
jgi:hypothetical protein